MSIYAIWESRFAPATAADGLRVTEAIWRDMPGFDGYLGHDLLVDADDPGHLLVVSQWSTRQHADRVLAEYTGHPNAREANRLVTQPRYRFIAARHDTAEW